MSRHRLVTVYAPTRETRSVGALVGGLAPIAGLAVLASFYSGPVAVVAPPELSSAQPVASAPPWSAPAVKPVISVVDFVPNSGRLAGKDDGERATGQIGRGSFVGSPSSPHGARAHSEWGGAREPHHFEGHRHERWTAPSPDGDHRRVRDSHWLHGGHRGAPGRHRHLDGHHADGGAQHHHDSAGRHHRADNHVGGYHQGAHSHGGHHRG